MRIRSVRSVLLSYPTDSRRPMEWVGGRIESWDAALVEITTDDGIIGVGEVAQGIMSAAAVPGIVEALAPYIIGMEVDEPWQVSESLRAKTYFWARGGVSAGVIGAVEIAAWDAAGKQAGKPVHALMSEDASTSVEVYASGGLGTSFEQVAAWVESMQDAGFPTVKFRAMDNPDRTIALVDEMMTHLRSETRFILDAVQGCAATPWSHEEAIRVGHHLRDLPVRWYEEPCRVDDLEGYVRIRQSVSVPISGAESVAIAGDLVRLVEVGGVDVVQPDVSMLGGPSAFREVARAADAAGIQCVPHVWGSGVTLMANLHTSLGARTVDLFEMCTLDNPLRDALLVAPLAMVDGRVSAPTAPGLGVDLTPEIEKEFPFIPGAGHVIR